MPTSFASSIPTIVKLMQQVNPVSILDIGVGMGKYGVLAREYCPRLAKLDGIEGYRPYLSYQNSLYDEIFIEDARLIEPTFNYNLVLMIDIIEHFAPASAEALLELYRHSHIIVSTPKEDFRAHYSHNPLEDHVAHYPLDWFRGEDHSTVDATIVLIKPHSKV